MPLDSFVRCAAGAALSSCRKSASDEAAIEPRCGRRIRSFVTAVERLID
jgi:hypothetical protein